MPGFPRKTHLRFLITAAVCAETLTVASCMGSGDENPGAPRSSTTRETPAQTASPTPSTPEDVSAAIRKALAQRGTGAATLVSHENTYKTVSHYRVDCASSRPRAEFGMTTPGRQGAPAEVKLKIITDGSDLYSRALNGPLSKEDKPWYRGKIRELDTNEFQSVDRTTMPRMGLYLTNCDQPAVIALLDGNPGRLAKPGVYRQTIKATNAASKADGYAKDFYEYVKSIGVTKVRSTVWMDGGFRVRKYQIATDGENAPAARWVVTFDDWAMSPIRVPPKSSVRS